MSSSEVSIDDRVHNAVDELFDRSPEQGVTHAFVARRGGVTVAERYGTRAANVFEPEYPVDATSTLLSWSMAKSVVHAAVGILVSDGLIDLDAPAPVPEWTDTDRKSITLMHLLEMRPGLRFVEDYVLSDASGDGVVGDAETSHCIEMLFGGTDPSFGHYAAVLPLEHPPGAVFNYSSGTTNIVARIIGDIVSGGPGGDPDERRTAVETFLSSRLFAPAGMTSATPRFDDVGDFVGSSYLDATAIDFARFGELYLHDGVTECGTGERILPAGWMEHARTWSGHDDETGLDYGRHFWLWPAFPGSLACHGYEGQFVVILPDRDLVLVHLGATDIAHSRGLQMRLARLAELLR